MRKRSAAALLAGLVLLLPGVARASTRTEIYPPAIEAISQTESWYGAIYVDDHICSGRHRPCAELTEHDQRAIAAELTDLPRFRFVSEPGRVIRSNSGVRHHGLLVSLGEIHLRPSLRGHERAVVGMSGYCGNLCGHFLTYKLIHGPHRWRVSGTVGGIGIA